MGSRWDKVEEYFYENGTACADCPYLKRWSEPREFWGACTSEEFSECMALAEGHPEWCPVFNGETDEDLEGRTGTD